MVQAPPYNLSVPHFEHPEFPHQLAFGRAAQTLFGARREAEGLAGAAGLAIPADPVEVLDLDRDVTVGVAVDHQPDLALVVPAAGAAGDDGDRLASRLVAPAVVTLA